jgi:two-component system, NarL family, response regulator NreC
MPIRVLIADDHGVLRAGLNAMLSAEPDLEVVGEAGTGEEALRQVAELHPDLVLMDVSMPEMGGIEATRRIKEVQPETHVLILTVHEDIGLVREVIHAGAAGYIPKRAVKTEVINAIHTVLHGDIYVHPAMMRALLTDAPKPADQPAPQAEALTPREIDVLRLVVKGFTNSQIAEKLYISVRTVEYHRGNLTGKLNLHSRVELIRYAAEHGIS